MGFWENVKRFNERWNDLPRRGAIVLMVLLALLAFAGLFSYIAPSVIAMVLAWVIHPVAKRLENVFRKIKLPAKLASLIAVIVMYGIVSFILFWIGARVVEELRSLIAALPGWVSQASDFIQKWTAEGGFQTFGVEMFGWQVFDVPPEITDFINAVVNEGLEFVKNFSLSMVGTVSNWTISTVMNLPQIILFIVLTIMGTFYMVADRKRIFAFFERWIPQRATGKLKLLKDTVFRGIAGQIKSALIMMALIAVELSVGFVILRVPYSVLLALLIGIMDALPIIGAGLFLIPMSAFGFITGDIGLGRGRGGFVHTHHRHPADRRAARGQRATGAVPAGDDGGHVRGTARDGLSRHAGRPGAGAHPQGGAQPARRPLRQGGAARPPLYPQAEAPARGRRLGRKTLSRRSPPGRRFVRPNGASLLRPRGEMGAIPLDRSTHAPPARHSPETNRSCKMNPSPPTPPCAWAARRTCSFCRTAPRRSGGRWTSPANWACPRC